MALAADLIVGMDSEFLVETCLLGKVTVSLQPNLMNMEDSLPTNRMGVSLAVYQAEEIEAVIEKSLFDTSTRHELMQRLKQFRLEPNGSRKVADLLLNGIDKQRQPFRSSNNR
jgi:hypothetical protein